MKFLSELLEEDDIPTLQEYMGYCLIPSNKAQKLLIILGKGGEGKSRIGLVMRKILGTNMNVSNIQKVEHNRFARADLEYRLLMVDDDMKLEALKDTNYIKTIVTLEDKMDLERKSKQPTPQKTAPFHPRLLTNFMTASETKAATSMGGMSVTFPPKSRKFTSALTITKRLSVPG